MFEIRIVVDTTGDLSLLEHRRRLRIGLDRAIRFAVAEAQRYPPQAHRPAIFFTDRQRRWFFWALRNGVITVPYQRTYTLQRGWTTRVGATRAEARNETPYGPWVMGAQRQAYMHRGVWPTERSILEGNRRRITSIVHAALVSGA